MSDRRLIGIGIAGVVVAAVCCSTPIAVVALGALGLASLAAWVDPVVLIVALIGAGLIVYGVYRRRGLAPGAAAGSCDPAGSRKESIR